LKYQIPQESKKQKFILLTFLFEDLPYSHILHHVKFQEREGYKSYIRKIYIYLMNKGRSEIQMNTKQRIYILSWIFLIGIVLYLISPLVAVLYFVVVLGIPIGVYLITLIGEIYEKLGEEKC